MDRASTKSYELLYRLLAAWVNGVPQGGTTASEIDFETLWQIADRHSLSAAVCLALEAAGLLGRCPPSAAGRFSAAKGMSIRKTLLMDAERKKLLAFMEERKIWYMPLKGVILNGLYPQYGARQFADNDILFDASRQKDVRDFMVQSGYKAVETGKGAHDVYQKPPLYNFELHRMLFRSLGYENTYRDTVTRYYADVKSRLRKDADNGYGYHFSGEDFYIYFIAHAFKHYDRGGTGVRTLLDLWLYRQRTPELDAEYIAGELEKLGISDFERSCRTLAEKLFDWPQQAAALTGAEREMLSRMESSGTYGTVGRRVHRELHEIRQSGEEGQARWAYLRRRLFPPLPWYRVNAPFCYRHRWAIPFYWVFRLLRGIFTRGKRIRSELAALRQQNERAPGP